MRSALRALAGAVAAQFGSRWRAQTRRGRSLCLCSALVATGCGDNGAWSVSSSTGGRPDGALVAVQNSGAALPPFAAKMVTAPYTTPFRGLRRVVLHRDGGVFDYLESVGADGRGRIAVEVPQVFRLPVELDPVQGQMLLELRGHFGYRVRDPHITDLALFALNWRVMVLARNTMIAGQSCWRLDVRRAAPLAADDSVYELAVDPATGLVLAWRETDILGNVRSEVEYTTFELGADVSTMDLRERNFDVVELDAALDLSTQVGARVYAPTHMPPGFELEVVELLTLPAAGAATGSMPAAPRPAGQLPNGPAGPTGEEWVKFGYSDGFERAFFLHPIDRTASVPAPTTSSVAHFPFGSWTFAVGRVNGRAVIAAGKVPALYLAELIQTSGL